MHLSELLKVAKVTAGHSDTVNKSVPDWMIGCFKRKSITFANGKTDKQTHVFWLQGRNITIDLRLPIESEWIKKTSLNDCTKEELMALANYEGWSADSCWENEQLSWSGGTCFQLHNRWPEPAILSRVGDCMVELSPNGSYVEDWRIQSKAPGVLVSLELIDEVNITTGVIRHKKGALIINNNWAALVLGRKVDIALIKEGNQLRDEVNARVDDKDFVKDVMDFETSVATGNINHGFTICYSTTFGRINKELIPLNGFEIDDEKNELTQCFVEDDQTIKRRFKIDALEDNFFYSNKTEWDKESEQWFGFEQETLGRYLSND